MPLFTKHVKTAVQDHQEQRTRLLSRFCACAKIMETAPVRVGVVLFVSLLALLSTVVVCNARDSCPDLPGADNGGRIRNLRSTGEVGSEFECSALWKNWDHMRSKVKFMLKNEEKKFIRFRAPVQNYTNPRLGLEHWSGKQTWVWVSSKFHYMLYYPHNFLTLSLGTPQIIVASMKNRDICIDCTHCGTSSCGIGFFQLRALINNVSEPLGEEWEYLCVEADNGMSDIVSDYPIEDEIGIQDLNTYNFALPDIYYQARFLKKYFSSCSFLALSCKNVSNYFCYDPEGNCIVKEVLSHYNVIIYLAFIFWLFFPILVFYLPSSQQRFSLKHIDGMFPTCKSPVYFGRCLQNLLCYRMSIRSCHAVCLIRSRRALGVILLAMLSFRFLILPNYQLFSWSVFLLFSASILRPQLVSVYIKPEVPLCFPLFSQPYPNSIIKWTGRRENSIEYQKLAYIMLERIYVTTDPKFWTYLVENSFYHLHLYYNQHSPFFLWFYKVFFSALAGLFTLSLAVVIVVVYFIVPLPYFTKELFLAINSGVCQHCTSVWHSQHIQLLIKVLDTLLSVAHAAILCSLLLYLILTLFSLCFLLTEVTIFTYMGASIVADKVLHYFVLIVAFGTAVYTMIHAIHKLYSNILKDTIFLLENDSEFEQIKTEVSKRPHLRVKLRKSKHNDIQLLGVPPFNFQEQIYHKEAFTSYMNSKIYFSIVETLQPIRRQMLLLFIKLFLMIFFIIISMWVKNVYKNESKVSDIFTMAGNMAVYFIPTALQFLSSQGQFGRKTDAQQKIGIVNAVVDYIQMQSDAL